MGPGHSHRILKVNIYYLLSNYLGLGLLHAMTALMRGPVQYSVERYYDICGPVGIINTHLHQLFSAKGFPYKKQ